MTTIGNAAPINPVQGASWAPIEGLTAEGVLAYCGARLNSLDSLIKSRFDEQKQRNAALKEAGALITALNAATWGLRADGNGDADFRKGMGAGLAKMFNATSDPQVRGKIAEAFRVFTGKDLVVGADGKAGGKQLDPKTCELWTGDGHMPEYSAEQWQQYVGGVKQLQDGLSKDSELSMIQLQSIVSQRQQAVQMATQLLAAMHDGCKQAIGNTHG
jgi:hypothetical protein